MNGKQSLYSGSLKSIFFLGIMIFMLSVRLIFGAIYLWDGIVWVYLGDSITESHQYNQYMEAYFHLRYPGLKLHFREAGVSGATQEDALEIYECYVYSWMPDVVSVMYGHNGDYLPSQYKDGMLELCDTIINAGGSLPVLLGPQPLYISDDPRLGYFSDSLASISRDQGWPFADDWHHLKPIWDKNYNSPVPVDLHFGDPVHPGPAGHLCMTYALLRTLDTIMIISGNDTIQERTTDIVSSAAIDASTGLLISSTKCMISNIKKTERGIRFTRKDKRLPMPFDEAYGVKARAAIDLMPEILDSLNRYMLKITGLPAYSYDINIDGVKSATVTSRMLARGWNMAGMSKGPIYDQLMNVLNKIRNKEGLTHDDLFETMPLKGNARYKADAMIYYQDSGESRELLRKHLSQPGESIPEVIGLDNAIHNAAQPVPHVFEIYETENQKPVVAAGNDQTVIFPDSASIIGGVNDDGLPNPPGNIATMWEKVEGPGLVYFRTPSTQITKAGFSDTGTYVLRFRGYDGEFSDTDEVTIYVKERDTVPPEVKITAPNNGEFVPSGKETFIRWTSSDNQAMVDSCFVFLSTDNMATWNLIGKNVTVDGNHVWPYVPPKINADSCWVIVKVIDPSRNIGIDTCDSPFRIIKTTGNAGQVREILSEPAFSAAYSGNSAIITVISPQAGKMDIEIYNIQGKLLWNYTSAISQPGHYKIKWNPGSSVNAGIWLIKVMTETKGIVNKVTLVR